MAKKASRPKPVRVKRGELRWSNDPTRDGVVAWFVDGDEGADVGDGKRTAAYARKKMAWALRCGRRADASYWAVEIAARIEAKSRKADRLECGAWIWPKRSGTIRALKLQANYELECAEALAHREKEDDRG